MKRGSRQVYTTNIDETRRHRKWQKIYVIFPKADTLQKVITEGGKSQPSTGDKKKVEAIINPFITGQVGLSFLTSKLTKINPLTATFALKTNQLIITYSTVKRVTTTSS